MPDDILDKESSKIDLLECILNDSMDIHHGYPLPKHIYTLAIDVLKLPESIVDDIFKRHDFSSAKNKEALDSLQTIL